MYYYFREKTHDKTILSFGPILEPFFPKIWSMVDMLYRNRYIFVIFVFWNILYSLFIILGDALTTATVWPFLFYSALFFCFALFILFGIFDFSIARKGVVKPPERAPKKLVFYLWIQRSSRPARMRNIIMGVGAGTHRWQTGGLLMIFEPLRFPSLLVMLTKTCCDCKYLSAQKLPEYFLDLKVSEIG